MQSLLVTGAAGFIGSELTRQLVRETDVRVVALDVLNYAGCRENLGDVLDNERLTFVEGSIGDGPLIGRLLREHGCTAVVNLAAQTHVDRSIVSPVEFARANVADTTVLLESALGFWRDLPQESAQSFRFVQVSTDEVYGALGSDGEFSEESPYAPSSPYSASKAAADHFVRAFQHTYGLPVVVTCSSNNYGPFQFPEKLIPVMIRSALAGNDLPVYGSGEQIRDWLHVSDQCRALRVVIDRGRVGETYNIGGNCQRTNNQIVESICRLVDELSPGLPHSPCTNLIRHVADRPGHDFRYALDTTKIEQELGWRAEVDLDIGLRQTVGWYVDHSDWVARALKRADDC